MASDPGDIPYDVPPREPYDPSLEEPAPRNDRGVFGCVISLMGVLVMPLFPAATLVSLVGLVLAWPAWRRTRRDPSAGARRAAAAGVALGILGLVGSVLLAVFGFGG